MTWATAVTQIRSRLYDTDESRLRWQKKVFGSQDGVNLRFKTFEQRRITDFTTPTNPEGVYVNGILATVTGDFPEIGEFLMGHAPLETDDLRATYYLRLFFDSELAEFLNTASEWLGFGSDYNSVTDGLRPSALCYAAAEAYQNLAVRYAEMPSEQYRLEDSPDDAADAPLDRYFKVSESFRKQAKMLRDHYYTRQGKPLAPNYGVVRGKVPNIP